MMNAYEACVTNAIIKGMQCTMAWYFDNMKISHMDVKVISMVIKQIEAKLGKMIITRGYKHTFLGMDLKRHCGDNHEKFDSSKEIPF